MALTLFAAPDGEPVTLAEAKSHLRVDVADDDVLITALITGSRLHLDGRDGWLNRALVTQDWDLTLDAFPAGAIEVPLPPLQSITHIKYLDTTGVEQTWPASKYTVDIKSAPGRIEPAYGETYPSTRAVLNAVTIRFRAGYGAAAAVPEAIKLGLKCLIAQFYEQREPVNVGNIVTEIPMHVDRILAPYKVWVRGHFG